ncbi:MAG: efflux RND transporter periplasmic adaptor subunit [Betaproteobacteria bacterium]
MIRSTTMFAALFAALALAGCGAEQHAHDEAKEKAAAGKDEHAGEDLIKLSSEEIKRAGIRVAAAEEAELADEVLLTATVQANRERIARIAPRVPGRIVSVLVRQGDAVKAGQTLAVLDSIEVGEAHSAFLQARSDTRLAQTAHERAERLAAEQVIAAKELQRARAELEKARTQLAAADSKLRMLGVEPRGEPGERATSTFALVASRAGVVLERNAVPGDLAKPDEPLFTVADLSALWIEANVSEKDLARVRPGAAAKVTVAAYPDAFQGKVAYIGATMDKETRTVLARIEVANPDGRLKPEMFATAAVSTGGARKALAIPESAVTLLQGLATVFVEEGEGFEARPVQLGARSGGNVVIASGIQSGDLVVVEGVYALKARALKKTIGAGHAH